MPMVSILSCAVTLWTSLPAARAQSCWGGGVTPEMCCNPAPRGNPDCWDETFTYERCCTKSGPPQPSQKVASLKISPSSVPRLPLLSGGGKMPMSGVGLCCRPSASGDAVRQAVLDYLVLGGRLLDTASLYSNHVEVGQGVQEALELGVPREDIFVTTKLWDDIGFERATDWVDEMLKELGLDYVDLVLLHKPTVNNADGRPCGNPKQCRQESWLALARAQSKGLIKHLGVSNFGPRQMQELINLGGAPVDVNQIEYHPWAPAINHETAAWCHQRGIVVTAYGSMGSSGLASQMISQDGLRQIGAQHGKTAGQVLLRWAVQKNVTVIPGTSNPDHMAQNLGVFDFKLSDGDMAMLDGIPDDQRMNHFGHEPDRDQ